MEKLVLDMPTLWADHHVLKVREALLGLKGVEDVYASSAWKKALVTFDGAKTDQAAIEQALSAAGYPVGAGEIPVLVTPTQNRKDPQWAGAQSRNTQTNRGDLEMSGEFRRY